MTVKQLIATLQGVPQGLDVAISRDAEGNGFSLLYQVSQEPMEKRGRMLDFSEGENTKEYVVLWPVG